MIKAIDTTYKGYKFRSRLEARFAVFLDALGVNWDYEIEGYTLPVTGNYLPDFYLERGFFPDELGHYSGPIWVEIKHSEPTVQEINKLRELVTHTETPGVFFSLSRGKTANIFEEWYNYEYSAGIGVSIFHHEQYPLDGFYPEPQSLPDYYWDDPDMRKVLIGWINKVSYNLDIKKIRPAAKAALSARFEFGESG